MNRLFATACTLVLTIATAHAQPPPPPGYPHMGPPPPPREVIPPVPAQNPKWVWRGGYYRWHGGSYVWAPGAYAAPPRPGYRWYPGHWRESPHGWVWVDGHWR